MWTSNRMRPALVVLAALSLCWPSAAHSQAQGPAVGDSLAQRLVLRAAALRVERERALLEHYAAAPESLRARADEILRAGRDPRRARRGPLNLSTIAAAQRVLQGNEPGPEFVAWADLVDSLDLSVVPGLFAAREEGLGEALTVVFHSLWEGSIEREPEGGIEASLYWVSPAGERRRARSEPVSLSALREGFEMYIRPPASAPALWSLVFELRTFAGVVASAPVVVECVGELAALRSSAAPLRVSLRELLERRDELRERGLRRASGLSLSAWSSACEGAAPQLAPRPYEPRSAEGEGPPAFGDVTMWEVAAPGAAPARTYLLLAGSMEHPTDLLTGAVGRSWARVAEAQGARVLAARVPLPSRELFDLRDFVSALKRELETEQLVVVARGDFGRVLPGLLQREPCAAIDALVLSETPAARALLPAELELPVLQLELSAEVATSEGVDAGARRARVRLRAPAPTGTLAAPDLIAAWAAKL